MYASEIEGRSLVAFGLGMLYNHKSDTYRNTKHFWADTNVKCAAEDSPESNTTPINYYANRDVLIGEELFTSYGEVDWFSSRSISYFNNDEIDQKYSIEHLKQYGVCMTNVYVWDSLMPLGGRGLFANKSFKKGELVYVSPVLLIPKSEVILSSNDSVLLNYVFASTSPSSDIALLPLGLSAIANHQSALLANLRYDWFNITQTEIESLSIEKLLASPFAPLDLAYYAIRDIDIHEELTIDYGIEWINAFATYLAEVIAGFEVKFRYPIQPAHGLFPKSWLKEECIRPNCLMKKADSSNKHSIEL